MATAYRWMEAYQRYSTSVCIPGMRYMVHSSFVAVLLRCAS